MEKRKMKLQKKSVVLLALLLAAMAMVPMVSAEENFSSSNVIGMKYFSNIPDNVKSQSSSQFPLSEYSLITVDSPEFMKDADCGKTLELTLDGKPYSLHLTPQPSIIAPTAKLYIKTQEGTKVTDIPQIRQYKGSVTGENEKGDAVFTVDKDVILGRISVNNESYFIEQSGIRNSGKIVHIVYNAKNEITRTKQPNTDDIYPMTISHSPISVPDKKQIESVKAPLSTSTVTLLAVYDTQFQSKFSSPSTEIASMMSTAGNAFSPSYIGVNFQINSFVLDSTLTRTSKDTLTTQLISSQSANRDSTSSDLVLLSHR
ncbi:MAG: hypothetical protein GYA23_04220 [Methanomicrobiales archaeon]|nr:hypothetical protein [Methanomicrobiales archaeon]